MLPDQFIYEELERQKRQQNQIERLAYLEIPRQIPYWPEQEETKEQDRDKNQIDVVIINM